MPSFRINSRGHLFFTNQSGSVKLRNYSLSRGNNSSLAAFTALSKLLISKDHMPLVIESLPHENKNMGVKRGDCIITEEPFVYALKSKYRKDRCDVCLKHSKLLKCSHCKTVYYCSSDCQMKTWKQHKIECPLLKKIYPKEIPDAARMLMRILIRLDQGGDYIRGYYSPTEYRKFSDLLSHYQEIKEDTKRRAHLESLFVVVNSIFQGSHISVPDLNTFMVIYGRFITNGFNILDAEMNSIATAIYLGVSVVDHSCLPNAVATFEGPRLNIFALEDMPTMDWSKIRISYIDVLNPTIERRKDLLENYYFWCDCPRCESTVEETATNAAKCPNSQCASMVNINQEECLKCRTKITAYYRDLFIDAINFTTQYLHKMKNMAYLDVCEVCLRRQESIVHPMNLWHVKTLDAAFDASIAVGKWSKALEYGLALVPGFRQYYGEWNPMLGILYVKLGKLQLNSNMFYPSVQNFTRGEDILKISHGRNHSIIDNQLRPMLMDAMRASSLMKQ